MVSTNTCGLLLIAGGLLLAGGSLSSAVRRVDFRVEETTIADVQRAFDARSLTCVQLVTLYLDRIRAYDDGGPHLNSITTVSADALQEARRLDRAPELTRQRGSLHCVPVLLKDNIDAASMPTTNGSVLLKGAVPARDAFLVARLRAAGALILGKAAMGEFAGGSYNTVDGQTLNPYHFGRETGGSSSGSAAAVSANLALAAVGTDTSTSVRGPAAFTGVVGLRPTTGLISRAGIAPKNLHFDTAGPVARTVRDAAMLLDVMAGADPDDPLSGEVFSKYPAAEKNRDAYRPFSRHLRADALRGARLGVLEDFFAGDPEITALARTALKQMERLGAHLIPVRLDPQFLDDYVRNSGRNIRRIADYRFRGDWESYLARFGPSTPKDTRQFVTLYETRAAGARLPVESSVLDLLKRSLATSSDDPLYRRLVNEVLPAATALKLAVFERDRLDALVFPYQPAFAPPIENPVRAVKDAAYVAASGSLNPATLAGYSSVGFPGVVVPMGVGSHGLPMGISFMGRPYAEGRILGFAYAYEQATGLRRPSPLLPPVRARTPHAP